MTHNGLYPIYDIADEHAEIPETLGTKEKFWIRHMDSLKLLKFGRPGTGEDWAEKVACELAELIGLPHAHYDLARHKGRGCVVSPSLIAEDGRLILGNELINSVTQNYNGARSYQQREHTVSRVLASLKLFTYPNYIRTWDTFIGYLMFDAWIGNTDRHHENWGLVIDKDRSVSLSPTFDHASSMGRELTDATREARLTTKDPRFNVEAFAAKARSALYADPSDKHPLSPIQAFQLAARAQRQSGFSWLRVLAGVDDEHVSGILNRIPAVCMSRPARDFAMAVLTVNRGRLLTMLVAER